MVRNFLHLRLQFSCPSAFCSSFEPVLACSLHLFAPGGSLFSLCLWPKRGVADKGQHDAEVPPAVHLRGGLGLTSKLISLPVIFPKITLSTGREEKEGIHTVIRNNPSTLAERLALDVVPRPASGRVALLFGWDLLFTGSIARRRCTATQPSGQKKKFLASSDWLWGDADGSGGDEVSKTELILPQASDSTEMGMRSSPPCLLSSRAGASDDGGHMGSLQQAALLGCAPILL